MESATSMGLKRPILSRQINFPLTLAPMVGLSHVVLRELCLDYMPKDAYTIWPTEMLNSRRLPNEKVGATPETMKHSSEQALVPQILGNEESSIAESISRLKNWGASAIDINMGCPVQKALKHNYGVSLMGDVGYASEVVKMAKRSSELPVSVKLRAGLQKDEDFLFRFTHSLQESGANWICLHPRIAEQKRRGRADWSQIKKVRDRLNIPVIGNGDIQVAEDVLQMLEETECDMVMAGRALTARPWLFWQVGERLGFKPPLGFVGLAPKTPEEEGAEYGRYLIKALRLCFQYFPPHLAMRKFRFLVKTGAVWLTFGHALVALTTRYEEEAPLKDEIEKFFSQTIAMSPRTDLRQ